MGTPLKVLDKEDGWAKVETPEGYKGYVIDNALHFLSQGRFESWKKSPRAISRNLDTTWLTDTATKRRVTDIVAGSILEVVDTLCPDMLLLKLPDGRRGLGELSDFTLVEQWARQCDKGKALDSLYATLVSKAEQLMGTPYLWGGTTTKSMDCSGFTKLLYYDLGVILPRDASQQAKVGMSLPIGKISAQMLRPGDLLFWGRRPQGNIIHVGVYCGEGQMIHCSGRVQSNGVVAGAPRPHYQYLLKIVRLNASEAQRLSAIRHPWYF